jgi:hypothetical protein
MTTELRETYTALIVEQRKLQTEFQEKAKNLFKTTFDEFFKLNPGINAVIWTQYSPYFNDGDSCEFSVNQPTFTNATGDDLDDIGYDQYDGENESVWATDNLEYTLDVSKEWLAEDRTKILNGPAIDIDSCDLLSEMLTSDEFENVLEVMFGNHTKIVATRDGFDELEYEHD